jgi:hypothetical protein
MNFLKMGGSIFCTLFLLTSCGGKSLAETACETYESGNLSMIVPTFAALVREEPLFTPYLKDSEVFVTYKEDLVRNQESKNSDGQYKVNYFRVTTREFDEARTSLNSFCTK